MHVRVNHRFDFRSINGNVTGKKLVHKIEPIFNNEKTKMRIFLEDGSLAEYAVHDLTTAEVRRFDRVNNGEDVESL